MKNLMFVLILFFQCTQGYGQSTTRTPDQLLSDAIEQEACIGIAAGYSIQGNITWENGAGWSEPKTKVAFRPNTLTRIASVTKPMTAVAILQLYEQGKVDLDAPVHQYVPDFPKKKEGVITVRQLLQHSSGIDGYTSEKERNNKKNYPTLADAAKIFQDRDLVGAPGEAFNYSSYGYVLLGLVIENVSGMSYEAYLKKNIWDKVGMTNTSIEKQSVEYSNKAELFHRKNNGKIKEVNATDLSDRLPGGGVHSTVIDLLKFGDALLDDSLLKASTFEMMIEDSKLKTEGSGYGMGWYLYGENPKFGNIVGHTGGQLGVSAMFMILPQEKISVIVLSNTSGALQEVSNIAVQLFHIAGNSVKE